MVFCINTHRNTGISAIDEKRRRLGEMIDRLMSAPDEPMKSEWATVVLHDLGALLVSLIESEEQQLVQLKLATDMIEVHRKRNSETLTRYYQITFDVMQGLARYVRDVLVIITKLFADHCNAYDRTLTEANIINS